MRSLVWSVLFALVFIGSGCGDKGETEQERLKRLVPNASKTTKVTGKVTIDGQPGKDVWVTLYPEKGELSATPSKGKTNDDGTFTISTYLEGDGAPPGEYNIILEQLTFLPNGTQWIGPDKLKNLYNDPTKTTYKVTVADAPVELPPFELKVEGVAAKPAPKTATPGNANAKGWIKPPRD